MTSSFANSITLSSIDKLVLDAFLNVGWFRNGNKIFTTQFLHHNGIIHDAIWLRIKLEKFKLSKSQKTQLKKLEKFTIQYDRFTLNDEKENLFKKYKTTAHFIKSQDLFYVLYDHEKNEIFVGRIRRDDTQPKTLNLWIVSDNLRKGAATNAVQILSYLYNNNLLNS